MRYGVLRDCYKKGVYYTKGEVRDLPESLVGSSIHFELLDEPAMEEPQSTPDALESTIKPLKDNICPECGKECKSALGLKSHSRIHK